MSTDEELINRNAELTKANAEAIRMFREDLATNEEKRESKLNGLTVILNNCVKILDQITYRMDTPQIGLSDRLNSVDENQKETAKLLGEVQGILGPLVERSLQTRKYMDWIIGGIVVYILTRLLPYVGQLLQKE